MNQKVVIAAIAIVVMIVGMAMGSKIQQQTKANQELSGLVQQLQARIDALEQKKVSTERDAKVIKPTTLTYRADPMDMFSQMERMHQQMNAMMRQTFDPSLIGMDEHDLFDPQMDIQEKGDQYVVTLDIPGMQKDNIKVEIQQGSLVVSGQRDAQEEKKDASGRFYRQERSFGKFMRVIPLPDDAKTDVIDANYKDGVLTVSVGRQTPAPALRTSQHIQVK